MPLPPFQAVLDEHRDTVARFLVAWVGPQEAEDALQETLISAIRAYPRLRAGSNVRAWMLTIARNKAMDSHRARVRRPDRRPRDPTDRAQKGDALPRCTCPPPGGGGGATGRAERRGSARAGRGA